MPYRYTPRLDTARRQRGMSFLSLVYLLVTLGVIVLVGIKSVPVYLNAYDIRTTLHWAARQPRLQQASARKIQQAIQQRFDAGYVDNVRGHDFKIKRAGGGRKITIDYTQRRTLFFNISLLYSFSDSARLTTHVDE